MRRTAVINKIRGFLLERYFDGANRVRLAEIPAFAPNGEETRPHPLEEVGVMLKVLSEPAATAVAPAFHWAAPGKTAWSYVGILRASAGRGITRLIERHTIFVARRSG
jgi:hypothetical protein